MIMTIFAILCFLWLFTTATGYAVRHFIKQAILFTIVYLWCPLVIIYGAFFV